MVETIVVGGGIVGASAAYHLARSGITALLVDRKDQGQATAAGAGIVSAGSSLTTRPEVLTFSASAVSYYPDLIAGMAELGQTSTGYNVVGELFCARNEDEFKRLSAMVDSFRQRLAPNGSAAEAIEIIDGDRARSLFPALGEIFGAIHLPGIARVDGALLRDALLAGARHFGASQRYGAAKLLVESGKVQGIELDGERILTSSVVIAGGAWSNELLAPFGITLGLVPQRGQILHLTMPDVDTSTWPIIQTFSDQYILAFGPNRVVAGATREVDSGFDYRLTAGGTKSVLDYALSVAPGLASGTIHEWRIGFRPFSTDGMPFLGSVPGFPNVVVATGLGPAGLTLGPFTGHIAASIVRGETISADIGPFAIDRLDR